MSSYKTYSNVLSYAEKVQERPQKPTFNLNNDFPAFNGALLTSPKKECFLKQKPVCKEYSSDELFGKNSNGFSLNLLNNFVRPVLLEKDWRKKNVVQNKNTNDNSSTLSLHITAYENTVEFQKANEENNVDDEGFQVVIRKKGKKPKGWPKSGKLNTWKQVFADATAIKSCFEYPRMQEQPMPSVPEVAQFKASERLIHVGSPQLDVSTLTVISPQAVVAAPQNVLEEEAVAQPTEASIEVSASPAGEDGVAADASSTGVIPSTNSPTGEAPIECDASPDNLVCSICGKQYKTPRGLKTHKCAPRKPAPTPDRKRKSKGGENSSSEESEDDNGIKVTRNGNKKRKSHVERDFKKSEEVLYPKFVNCLEPFNIPEANREWLKTKLFAFSTATADTVSGEIVHGSDNCSEVKLSRDGYKSYRAILKAIYLPIEQLEDTTKRLKFENNDSCSRAAYEPLCINPHHVSIVIPKPTSSKITKKQAKSVADSTDKHVNELRRFIISKLPIEADDTVYEKAKKLSIDLIHFTGMDGLQLIEKLGDVSPEHDWHGTDNLLYSVEILTKCFKEVIGFLHNPIRYVWKYNDINVCLTPDSTRICLKLEHASIVRPNVSVPLPQYTLPKDPHPSELPLLPEASNKNADDENNSDSDCEDDEGEEDEEKEYQKFSSLVSELYKEYDETNLDSYDVKDAYENIINKFEQCFNTEVDNRTWNEDDDAESFVTKLPEILKQNKTDLFELIGGMAYGGGMIQQKRSNIDWAKAVEEAESLIETKTESMIIKPRHRHNFNRTIEIIKPFIAALTCLEQCTNVVTIMEADLDRTVTEVEIVTDKLVKIKEFLISHYLEEITSRGFNADDAWARGIRDITICTSAKILLEYLPFMIAYYNTEDVEDLLQKFLTQEFQRTLAKAYRRYGIEDRMRYGNKMQGTLNFLHGKSTPGRNIIDADEFRYLTAQTVSKAMVHIGIAVKIANIFPRSKEGFDLSSGVKLHNYIKVHNRDRVTSIQNILPLMEQDVFVYLNNFIVDSAASKLEKVFALISCMTGWRIETMISTLPDKLSKCPTPGIRIRDLKFFFTTVSVKKIPGVDITATWEKMQTRNSTKTTTSIISNQRMHDPVMDLIEFLNMRDIFQVNIRDDPNFEHPNALLFKDDVLDEFLFCAFDQTDRLIPFKTLPYSAVQKFMRNIAIQLKISKREICHRSYRKGRVFHSALQTMDLYRNVTSLKDIFSIVNSMELWKGDCGLVYLQTREDLLTKTLNRFKSLLASEPNCKPEDCHHFVSNRCLAENFIPENHPLVKFIVSKYIPFWFESRRPEKQIIIVRCRMVADSLNDFMLSRQALNFARRNLDDINPRDTVIDIEATFNMYTNHDSFISPLLNRAYSCIVPSCEFTEDDGSLRKHFNDQHKQVQSLQCGECELIVKKGSSAESLYSKFMSHLRKNHDNSLICRACRLQMSYLDGLKCKDLNHNVVKASSYITHYKKIEDLPDVAPPLPRPTINVTFNTSCSGINAFDKEKIKALINGRDLDTACGMLFGYLQAGLMSASMLDDNDFSNHKIVMRAKNLIQ